MKKITFLIAFLFAVCLNINYAQNTWKKKADFGGTGRYAAVGFSIGNKGYIGTGYDGNYKNDFWEYDPATNIWTQKADFGGTARFDAVGFSIGIKGYIGTGYGGNYKNDFWEYDPATNGWTQKTNFGGAGRVFAVGFSIGNKGYIGTGDNFDCCGGGDLYKDFWEYDPSADAWTRKADFGGAARWIAVGFSIGGKGYLGTGSNRDQSVYYKDFWEYDPATNAWTKKANYLGAAPSAETGFSIGDKGYVGAGQDHAVGTTDFWEYDPATDTWIQKADFGGSARWHAVGFSIGNKGYIGTGTPNTTKDFWEYTPGNTCLSPSGLNVQKISDTSAMLKWDVAGADILRVKVHFRVVGDTVWAIRTNDAAKTKRHIHGLIPNTTYEWQLRSFCAEDTSRWVKGPNFTTAASFAPSSATLAITSSKLPGNIHVQIMPNPNKGNFTIQMQLPAKAAVTTLALYNNRDKKIWQQDAGKISGAVRKNISLQDQLPAGIYMMVIQRNDVRLMQKIVINK